MSVTLEREVKLRFSTVEEAQIAVEATGATPLRCRRLQEDYLLDDAQESLRHRRCVLRVRIESGKGPCNRPA
jgi:adenylate cyclase class IV